MDLKKKESKRKPADDMLQTITEILEENKE